MAAPWPGFAGLKPTLPQVIVLLALPIAALLNSVWHLQAADRFTAMALVSVAATLCALTVGFGAVTGSSAGAATMAAIALTAPAVLVGLGTFAISRRIVAALGRRELRGRRPWALLAEGWPLYSSQLVAVAYGISGPVVVRVLAGAEQAGAYAVIERAANALIGASLLAHVVAYPRLAQLYARDRKGYLRLLGIVELVYLAVAVSACALVVLTWDWTLEFLLGQDHPGSDLLLATALVWLLVGSLGVLLTGYLTISHRGERVLSVNLRIMSIAIPTKIPGVLLFGAWAWMAALCLSQGLIVFECWRAWRLELRGLAGPT